MIWDVEEDLAAKLEWHKRHMDVDRIRRIPEADGIQKLVMGDALMKKERMDPKLGRLLSSETKWFDTGFGYLVEKYERGQKNTILEPSQRRPAPRSVAAPPAKRPAAEKTRPVAERRPPPGPALSETQMAVARCKAAMAAHEVAKRIGSPADIAHKRAEMEAAKRDLEAGKTLEVVHAITKAALARPMVWR